MFGRDFGLSPFWSEQSWSGFMPNVDVVERDNEITVTADLPGMEEKNIELQIEDNVLVIRGEREHRKEEKRRDVYRSECCYGSFRRSVLLPAEVNADEASARYKKGVLTVKLPKISPTQRRKITVNHA
jgi:HSP20 family protein